ncbi:glycosyltransferase [bacterium]|nr:glycosyltransferase [bacterium]
MKQINVLHLITSLNVGGTEKYLLTLIKEQKSKFNVLVGYIKEKGLIGKELEELGIKVYKLNSLYKIYRFIKIRKIDILHTHLYRANILGRVIGKIASLPIIISSQQSIDNWKKFYHVWLDRFTACFIDCIITNSEVAKTILSRREKVDNRKIHVVYNGVNTNIFNPRVKVNLIREKWGLGSKDFVVGSILRLHQEKGADYIPEIVLKVREKIPEIKFLVVGDGPLKKRLEEKIKKLSLDKNFFLTGCRVPEDILPAVLSSFDLFFLPSKEESLPQAILEAMAMEKPVVATEVGGVAEVVLDGTTGKLVPSGDWLAFAENIVWMFNHREERVKMGEEGRKRVIKLFSMDKMINQTQKIYEDLIKDKL